MSELNQILPIQLQESTESPVLDPKPVLMKHFPILFELLGDETVSWSKIKTRFNEVHQERTKKYIESNNYLKIEASFYDILNETINKNKSAERLFSFFNKLIEELIVNVPQQHIRTLKATIYSILINLDKSYLNFIGELLILNHLLKTGNFLLEDIEYPLGNGNSIDFRFYDKINNKSLFVEVVNIHTNRPLSADFNEISTFLSKRINDKVLLKRKHSNNLLDFILTPIVWAPHEDLHKIYLFTKSGERLDVKQSIEPLAFLSFYDEKSENLIHKFGTISTLFND